MRHVWHIALCAMGCAGDGGRPDIEWYGATAKRSGRFRDERSSGQRDSESHSTRETPVVFGYWFRTVVVWNRTFMM